MSQVISARIPARSTILITANNPAPTPVQPGSSAQYVISAPSTNTADVFVGWGIDAAGAIAAAVVPISGGAAGGYQLAPGQKEVITPVSAQVSQEAPFFTAIAASAQSLYVTPCTGI